MDSREYANCDAIELAMRVSRGDVTPVEVLDLAYGLIDRLDPQVNAFVHREAELAYATARSPSSGPLSGVPIAMKDCVGGVRGAVRDYGSRLATGLCLDTDDEVAVRLKAAGLVPMGTTNVPEFSSSLTAESRLHGPCRNPWDLARSTGGSSGGAAAAVACGVVPIAYGNDSAGSIRVPASCCGVFGLRPSRGRVPVGPQVGEIWYGLLSHHVITRSVRDSALVLDLIAGLDAGAPYCAPPLRRSCLEATLWPPGRLRVAVSDGAAQGFAIDPRCAQALAETATLLGGLGHDVEFASPDYRGDRLLAVVTTFLCVALAEELPGLAALTGRSIGPETVERCHLELMRRGARLPAVELSRALALRGELGRMLGRFFSHYDVLLSPTLAAPPVKLGELDTDATDTDDYLQRLWRYAPFTPLANVAGVPSMSVPLEWTSEDWPIGMMFTSAYGTEDTLFGLAAQLEEARPWRGRHPPVSAWT